MIRGNLPAWMTRLLGVEPAGSGQAVQWQLSLSWDLPPWVTLLLVVAAVGFVVAVYRNENARASRRVKVVCMALRCACLVWLLILLAQPVVQLQRTGLPGVVVMLDNSASMGTVDQYDDAKLRARLEKQIQATGDDRLTRLGLARMLLTGNRSGLLAFLSRRYRLDFYTMADDTRRQSGDLPALLKTVRQLAPTGTSSRLGAGLQSVLDQTRGAPPAAIVLLTDGITTHGPTLSEVAGQARHAGVPLLIVGLGSATAARDARLSDLLVDEVAFVGDVINFQASVAATGLAGQEAKVVLREADKSPVLAETKLQLGADGESRSANLTYRPTRTGPLEFVVEVTPLPGEAQTDNNRMRRIVRVSDEPIRTLLIAGYPNFEFRYLKRLLEREATIELQVVLQDADPDYASADRSALRSVPTSRDGWFAYDVIILSDADPAQIGAEAMALIDAFVTEKGGGLVLVAGPKFVPQAYRDTPLATLFPIQLATAQVPPPGVELSDAFAITPTDVGLASPPLQLGATPAETAAIWGALPKAFWSLDAPDVKPAARVLADRRAPDPHGDSRRALICMHYVGAGKVFLHGIDATWRWRYQMGDTYFGRYWLQLLRYLGRAKLRGQAGGATLSTDRREYRFGEPVRLRARYADERRAPARDAGVTIVVAAKDGPRRRVTLHRSTAQHGVFEAVASGLERGNYHAWIVTPAASDHVPSADFLVAAPPDERQRIRADVADLARAADVSRGQLVTIETARDLRKALPPGRQVPVETLPPIRLWNRWWVLVFGLGLLIGEWFVRKRNGML
jgi:hypothetical protein